MREREKKQRRPIIHPLYWNCERSKSASLHISSNCFKLHFYHKKFVTTIIGSFSWLSNQTLSQIDKWNYWAVFTFSAAEPTCLRPTFFFILPLWTDCVTVTDSWSRGWCFAAEMALNTRRERLNGAGHVFLHLSSLILADVSCQSRSYTLPLSVDLINKKKSFSPYV